MFAAELRQQIQTLHKEVKTKSVNIIKERCAVEACKGKAHVEIDLWRTMLNQTPEVASFPRNDFEKVRDAIISDAKDLGLNCCVSDSWLTKRRITIISVWFAIYVDSWLRTPSRILADARATFIGTVAIWFLLYGLGTALVCRFNQAIFKFTPSVAVPRMRSCQFIGFVVSIISFLHIVALIAPHAQGLLLHAKCYAVLSFIGIGCWMQWESPWVLVAMPYCSLALLLHAYDDFVMSNFAVFQAMYSELINVTWVGHLLSMSFCYLIDASILASLAYGSDRIFMLLARIPKNCILLVTWGPPVKERKRAGNLVMACRICEEAKNAVVIVPCGHTCCRDCSGNLGKRCPYCRQETFGNLPIYY